MKNYISLSIFMIITIFIASCGTNTPSSTTSPISKTNISSPTVGTITAYQGTVHKQVLTSHAIDILLLPENPGNLTKKQLTLLRTFRNDIEQGAWDEDYNNPYGLPNVLPIFRTINHFMDPQHGNIALSDPPFNGTPYSAIDWVYNGDSYMYLTAKQNFVVNIAGYDPNNTLMNTSGLKISMTDLGHVLHMFQDMSVPPHVRNDNHSGLFGASSSRYEDIGLASDPGININTMSPINITNDDDLYSKFIYLARTTSENFFSEDTIPDPNNPPPPQRQFPLPTLPSGIGYLPNQNTPLVIAQKDMRTGLIKYKLNDANDTIPYYYASQLMPKAISYTAGVIKYFLNLKTTGKVVINSHTDGQSVSTSPITVNGYLTYYAPEVAISIPNGTAIRTVVHASTTLSGGHYAFSYPVNLYEGSNQITVTADNENVEATSATIAVTYKKPNNVLEVVISDPIDGQVFPDRIISVSGMVNYFSGNSAILSVNGRTQTIPVANSGYFKADVILTSGSNTITVKVSDRGQVASDVVHVICTVPPSKLWVQLTWDQGGSDVDLYVTEPTGETAWYAYPRNTSGGYLDVDNTWGYGPEHYMISESLGNNIAPGDYVIQVHYYASHGNPAGITGQLTVLKDEKPYGVFPFTISQPNPSSAGPGNWIIDPASWWQEVRVTLP